MLKPIRSLSVLLLLGLLSVTLAVAFPAIAKPAHQVNQEQEQLAVDLLNLGLENYQAGKYTAATKTWQKAEQMYHLQGDINRRVASLNYLSMAHQELGQWREAEQRITQSIELLEQSELASDRALLAQALNIKGNLELATGKPEAALVTWRQAAANYQIVQDNLGVVGSKINQAQALQTIGLHLRAQKLLSSVRQEFNRQSEPVIKVKVLHSLGTTLQTIGDLTQSQAVLEEGLEIAEKFNLAAEKATLYFSLGNVYRLQENCSAAIAWYQKAIAVETYPLTKIEAQLNLLNSLIVTEQKTASEALVPQIQANLAALSPSRPTLYARINLAKNLVDLDRARYGAEIASLLKETIEAAVALKDTRAESSAWGTLGHYYEPQPAQAQAITEKALNLAEAIDAKDISYQWQWQLGRLLKAQNKPEKAIAPYTAAVNNLQSLRSSLVAINTDAQFSFRESVEPVYRELVGLLLDVNPTQKQLEQARNVIESLQLAELENFFQEACLDAQPKQIDRVDPQAAVIYPIILSDRVAVILSLPDRSLKYYSTHLPEAAINQTIDDLHQSLYPFFSNQQRLRLSNQVYSWLIEPAEADLAQNKVETLAFVLDGNLRNIPIAALYDGEQYVVQKYNIALTPGLQLLPSAGLKTKKLRAVVAGVSKSNQGFAALPGVEAEVTHISSQLSSELLLNDSFTDANFQDRLQKTAAPIVHLATHGQFGSTPKDTFINTWDDRLEITELQELLRDRESNQASPIELMVLSACQTATGDKRATLGMAGMAVRSGARSTLATLWSVKDESTSKLLNKFYQQLIMSDADINTAAALRQAQLSLIESDQFSHPFYWSPFVLVGNWK